MQDLPWEADSNSVDYEIPSEHHGQAVSTPASYSLNLGSDLGQWNVQWQSSFLSEE